MLSQAQFLCMHKKFLDYHAPMTSQKIILAFGLFGSSHVLAQNPQPEHWVWRNNKLVLLPPTINEPISSEARAEADNLHLRWKSSGNQIVPIAPITKSKPSEDFDPYLSDVHPPRQATTLRNRPKPPEFSIPPIEKPEFRKGDLPEVELDNPDDLDSSKAKSSPTITRKTSSETPKSPQEIQKWGVSLQKRSDELKIRHAQLKKERTPDSKELRAYVLDSIKLKEDLNKYRELAQEQAR